MLDLQNTLNKLTTGDAWLERKHPWPRAIWMEAAEAVEHVGWKWWKHQQCDLAQARMELIDIWHFALSDALQSTNGDVSAAATRILVSLEDAAAPFVILGKNFRVQDLSPIELLEVVAGLAAFGYTFLPGIGELFERFELSWDKLYQLYMAKNVLNIFRQHNGYKEGSYTKVWGGREDNEHLTELVEQNPSATPDQLLDMFGRVYGARDV